ncbi:HNH endonuclease [Sinorhizobium meliloti]|uniref:HNH endonuclease n=1 Tax=Rhizobium meliloti TaxID=382 RepID=UPI000B4A43AF|nr:HNH endonuclease signature motif containing protein [Sinorhizobium meliloti]ASP90463.1 HNH endonuclease [Sinorhizobium meliloti]MQX59242.1 HNH endonuclease [Sinorhizobium meliloti]RVG82975.1 HNH endonuclease [Sinorhizobium meliloti]RVI38581.1 HNH endonuclease [Sinorhizobium meliloti]RVI42209.1 HNH endonuclease [Sinorhizobium meliloti]
MTKPPRLCSCGNVVPHGELCICQQKARRERNARHDSRRPSARDRGYNHEWRKARAEYLAAHPHCRECSKHGVTQLATVVDHIIAHRGDRRLFWHRANWQPLCAPCHNSIKQRQERGAS